MREEWALNREIPSCLPWPGDKMEMRLQANSTEGGVVGKAGSTVVGVVKFCFWSDNVIVIIFVIYVK